MEPRWNPGKTLVEPVEPWWNPGGTLVEHPGAYLGWDPKAFSCWGKKLKAVQISLIFSQRNGDRFANSRFMLLPLVLAILMQSND